MNKDEINKDYINICNQTHDIKIGNTMVEFDDRDLNAAFSAAIPVINTFYKMGDGNMGLYYFNEMKQVYNISEQVVKKIEDALNDKAPKQDESVEDMEKEVMGIDRSTTPIVWKKEMSAMTREEYDTIVKRYDNDLFKNFDALSNAGTALNQGHDLNQGQRRI